MTQLDKDDFIRSFGQLFRIHALLRSIFPPGRQSVHNFFNYCPASSISIARAIPKPGETIRPSRGRHIPERAVHTDDVAKKGKPALQNEFGNVGTRTAAMRAA